jgi:hypothetical protein
MTYCSKYSRVPGNCKRPRIKPPIYIDTCNHNIQVVINYATNSGQDIFTLLVCKEDTFQMIKISIQERFNLPNTDFNVIYNGVVVNSLRKLEDYCIDTKNTRYILNVTH